MAEKPYEAYADEELVGLARGGDSGAADFLMEKYKPLVRRLSAARYLAGGDREDLIQEGMIGLYKALRDYDPSKQASFATFAALCADRQMLHAIEASQREKNRVLNDAVELTDEEGERVLHGAKESPETLVIAREAADERLRRLREALSPLETKVLTLYLTGMDYREIASELGRTPKTIDNALQRIPRKSRECMMEEERSTE